MVEYVVIILLFLGAGYFVISPFLESEEQELYESPEGDMKLRDLELKKEGAYATIKELEFDLKMGKLSEEDFETMKQQYMRDAMEYLKEIDQFDKNDKKKRNLSEVSVDEDFEVGTSATHPHKPGEGTDRFCTRCGEKASSKDLFCRGCGAKLTISA